MFFKLMNHKQRLQFGDRELPLNIKCCKINIDRIQKDSINWIYKVKKLKSKAIIGKNQLIMSSNIDRFKKYPNLLLVKQVPKEKIENGLDEYNEAAEIEQVILKKLAGQEILSGSQIHQPYSIRESEK